MKPNVAFIGTGWIGLNRMKALVKEDICNPVAIIEPDKKNLLNALEVVPGMRVFESIDELILKSKPDGLIIATPNANHADQCITALDNDIAVFCQKPLARNATECLEVISAAQKTNRLIGVDLSYRYTDAMQKILDVSEGGLGDIFAVDLVFNNAYGPDKPWFYDPNLSGGGCLLDLGVHMVDLALWILNYPEVYNISSVLFSKANIIDGNSGNMVEDYVSAQMVTDAGTLIRLVCSWNLSAGQDAEIKASFYGDKASALFYNVNGSFYDFEAAICTGTTRKIISSPPDDWSGKALISWARSLQSGGYYKNSAFQYYKTAEVIDRIYKRILTSKYFQNEDTTIN